MGRGRTREIGDHLQPGGVLASGGAGAALVVPVEAAAPRGPGASPDLAPGGVRGRGPVRGALEVGVGGDGGVVGGRPRGPPPDGAGDPERGAAGTGRDGKGGP